MDASAAYRNTVSQALAGFQLVEEMLKGYLDKHFSTTRMLLRGAVHFEFSRRDYQEAPLGRLVNVFSKLCANEQLIRDLRAAVKDRDHLAHRALLKLYEVPRPSEEEFMQLLGEASRMMNLPSGLMDRIVDEMRKLDAIWTGT